VLLGVQVEHEVDQRAPSRAPRRQHREARAAIFVPRSKSMMPSAGRDPSAPAAETRTRAACRADALDVVGGDFPTGTLACGRFGIVSSRDCGAARRIELDGQLLDLLRALRLAPESS
jgi:hypothetical protein